MTPVRRKVVAAIRACEREANTTFTLSPKERLEIADRILAVPEVRDALRFVEGAPGF